MKSMILILENSIIVISYRGPIEKLNFVSSRSLFYTIIKPNHLKRVKRYIRSPDGDRILPLFSIKFVLSVIYINLLRPYLCSLVLYVTIIVLFMYSLLSYPYLLVCYMYALVSYLYSLFSYLHLLVSYLYYFLSHLYS